MTFEIEIDGVRMPVAVEEITAAPGGGGRVRVRLGDRAPVEIDCRVTDLGLSLVWVETGRVLDAAVTERPAGEWFIQLPQVGITTTVDGRRPRGAGAGDASATGEQRLIAPMPGRVLRVLVAPGDESAARQGLVVVEAKKMENELRAVRAGRVKEIAVSEGMSVEAGRLLVVVE